MSNLLKDKYPELLKEWDFEKNKLNANEVNYGSAQKVWWICKQNHSFETSLNSKTRSYSNGNNSCPYCRNLKVGYGNDFKTNFPELVKEWDYEKNELNPEEVVAGSHKKVWWKCNKGHSYNAVIYKRGYEQTDCPYCRNLKVGYGNDLKTNFPELVKEWDYEKNELNPDEVVHGSNKKVWWKCNKGHSFSQRIIERTLNSKSCKFCTNQRVSKENNLKVLFPKIAKEWDYEKNELNPDEVVAGTSKKYFWICTKGHSWETSVAVRRNGSMCPYCSGHKPSEGRNLLTEYPHLKQFWDKKKNIVNIEDISPSTPSQFFWKCPKKHSWKSSVNTINKLSKNKICPYCDNRKVSDTNNFKITHPKLLNDWDYEKNDIEPDKILPGSTKVVYWKCNKSHSWETRLNQRTKHFTNCPYCTNLKASTENNLKVLFPELVKEWDYKKNELNPDEVVAGSNKKAWWTCSNNHSFQQTVWARTKLNNQCPYCAGRYPTKENNLKILFPELVKEWDYEKNELRPENFLSQSDKKVWWICSQGHNWRAVIGSRTPSLNTSRIGRGCPYCTLTPRSREEVHLLFELKQFFNIDENDHKIKLKRVEDVDIKLANEKVVIEYDGAYWHKDKAERDKTKTKALEKAGWTVIRVREKPLKVLSRKYNVSSKTGEYKETANKVLKKLNQLGYEVKGLDKYLERKTLINKKEAEKYIDNLLREKNKK